jgi:hypothetical protein
MNAGEFVFERAGADSADSNITFTRHFKIDANGNAFVENPSEARLQVKTPSNGIIALRADGGNTQLGTWSDHDLKIVRNTTIKASITANGLCFNSDTAAANALDDYEEGTWTAALSGGTVSNTGTQSGRSFKYTKIGNVVYFCFDFFQENNTMALSGTVSITGLPFGALPDQFHNHVSVAVYKGTGANINMKHYVNNSPHIVLTDNGSITGIRHLWGQGFYFTST